MADPKNFEKVGRKTIYQLHRSSFIANAHNDAFYTKKSGFLKKYEPMGGGGRSPPPPFESATG